MEISMLPFVYMPDGTILSNQAYIKLEKKLENLVNLRKLKLGVVQQVTTPENEATLFEIIEENPLP